MNKTDKPGTAFTRRVRERGASAVVLNYRKAEAEAMRAFIQSIRIKGDRVPSLSVIARRSMHLYLKHLQASRVVRPEEFQREITEIEKLVTPSPTK